MFGIRTFIAGLIATGIGIAMMTQGQYKDGALILFVGICALLATLPAWEVGRVNVRLLAQGLLAAFGAFLFFSDLAQGNPHVDTRRFFIPYANFPMGLLTLAAAGYALMAALGFVRRD